MAKADEHNIIKILALLFMLVALAIAGVERFETAVSAEGERHAQANLQEVNTAIQKYLEARGEYPDSLEALEGKFLTQPVSYLLLNPLTGQSGVEVLVADGTKTYETNIASVPEDKRIWAPYRFGGYAAGKQIAKARYAEKPKQ